MNCKKCGFLIDKSIKFCSNCGEPNVLYQAGNVIEAVVTEPIVEQPVVAEPVVEQPVVTQPVTAEPTVDMNQTVVTSEQVVSQETPSVEPVVNPVPTTPVTQVSNPAPKKGGNGAFIAIIIILGLIIVGAIVFIVIKFFPFGGQTNTQNTNTIDINTNTDTNSTIDNNKPSNNTNSSTTQTTTSSKYEKDGYTFTIPTGYTKTLENGSDYFESDHFFFGNIKTISGATYSYYKENLNTLIESFKKTIQTANSSISYLDGKELSYSGKKYLVISFYGSGYYRDIVFTELNDNTLVGFNVFYDSMTYEDTGYASITTFLNSAKKSETNSFSSDITESDIKEDQSFIDMPNFE